MKHNEIAQIVSRGYEKHTGRVGEVEYYIEGNVITFRGTEAEDGSTLGVYTPN